MYRTQGEVGSYGYIAYEDTIPRYVGIGSSTRHKHLLRGRSPHNRILNAYLKAGFKFHIETFEFESLNQAIAWEKQTILSFGRLCNKTGTLFNFSEGGEANCHGLEWWHNSSSLEEVRLPKGTPLTDGWTKGRSSKPNEGRRVWHNPETHEVTMALQPPPNWVRGYPPGSHAHAAGTALYFNPETGERKRFPKKEPPPFPWEVQGTVSGKKFAYKPKPTSKWLHARNPVTGERGRFPSASEVPEGWVLGTGLINSGSFSVNGRKYKGKNK